MTISIKSPTSTTGSIQKNGSDVLTFDSSDNVTVVNNLSVSGTVSSTGDINFDSNTLYVDATNNRVGIGQSSPSQKLDIVGNASVNRATATAYNLGGGIKFQVDGTSYAAIAQPTAQALAFYTGNDTTERMRIDSSGNVGIGTSSPSGDGPLSIERNGNASTELNLSLINGVSNKECILNFGSNLSTSDRYKGRIFYQTDNNVMGFWTNKTERMRLDQYGLHVGNTNLTFAGVTVDIANIPSGEGVGIKAAGVGNYMIEFRNSSGINCGTIVHNTSSSVSYNTTSDYRLKENTVNIDNGIEKVKLLKPYRFNYISDPDVIMDGFYAHEVQDVVPSAIHGTKDAVDDEGNPVYQGIDQSKLVPLLTAALQEAITKIEALETRIEALENPS